MLRAASACEKDGVLDTIESSARISSGALRAPPTTEDGGESWNALSEDATVSMNLWGFTQEFMADLERGFAAFLEMRCRRIRSKPSIFCRLSSTTGSVGAADVQVLEIRRQMVRRDL